MASVSESKVPGVPDAVLHEAQAAAASAQRDGDSLNQPQPDESQTLPNHLQQLDSDIPPPPYNSAEYGQLDISQNGMDTGAKIGEDGRVNIKINQRSRKLTNLLVPALRHQLDMQRAKADEEPEIPEGLGEYRGLPPPPMNIVIQIVGSRGDVQPFVALGQVLKNKYNHRVRIATHPNFRDFVTENGLEFFSIGGDPAELMAFMVKNPGLMPGFDTLKSGDVGKRRKSIYEIIQGCWRSCIEPGDGTGIPASDSQLDRAASFDSGISMGTDPTQKPFIADAIIANPPSFAHMHIAEKLGIPLHLMFTMPWSPTQAFPHPLANLISSNADANITNFISYALVDMLTWQGLGDVINRFRENTLHLEPVSIMWAPGMASRLRIPWTYCWSPALIPKPADWGNYIDISGFFFLNLASNYTPAPDLVEFLAAGPPPVYIGFGSIVVDDPNAMTKMIFDAVKKTGQRALVSKGWGGLGADELGIPEGVFMLGNCPHDWLFNHVSCVVHHGGAGTTATGISTGRPTVVVPFFGDQPFWGAMVARAGAGPMPIAYKHLDADKLASQILTALKPESLDRAKELSSKIKAEHGNEAGAESFHKQLHMDELRCSVDPTRVAVWRVRHTDIRLSSLAATVLGNEGLLDFGDLKLHRPKEYVTEDGPWEPVTGGASALIGTLGNLSMGIADFPVEILKSLKTASKDVHEKHQHEKEEADRSASASRHASVTNLNKTATESSQLSAVTSVQSDATSTSPTIVPDETDVTQTGAGHGDAVLSPATTLTATDSVDGKQSAMSAVMSSDGNSRHRRWSRHGSRSGSPSSSHPKSPSPCPVEDVGHITAESALGGAKAVGRIVSAGMKSPMDFTNALAKGFHNAPKLYGDTTVRKSEKITDLQSGIKAAGKEFGYGFFDGITGLVTQPVRGAQKEGFAGFVKGAAMGIGGLILKPGAAIWGLPGYTSKGIYASLHSMFGSSVHNYIIAARTAQGYEEWKDSTPEQRMMIVSAWKSNQLEKKRGGKKYGKEREAEIQQHISRTTSNQDVELLSGFKNTRHLTFNERKVLAAKKEELRKEQKELGRQQSNESGIHRKFSRVKHHCDYCPFDHDTDYHLRNVSSFPSPANPAEYGRSADRATEKLHAEYEEAIQKSVTATSRGDPHEDELIERALRASVKELQQVPTDQHDEDAYQRAVAASIDEVRQARAEAGGTQESGVVSAQGAEPKDLDEDAELTRALTQSLEEHKIYQATNTSNGSTSQEDPELQRALEESRQHHAEQDQKRQALGTDGNARIDPLHHDANDDEIKQAMDESHKHEEELQRQRTEDMIVLEHVKKQSLLEEEYRQQKAKQKAS